MNIIKGKGQRLIPEELLKYLEAFKENHPDPTQGGGATLDDIVDSQGNKRFIEGNGTVGTVQGLTPTYNKWSLSGTHLMCVLAAHVDIGSHIYNNTTIASFEVPVYIGNKIFPVWNDNITRTKLNIWSTGGSLSQIDVYVKYSNNVISIVYSGSQYDFSFESNFRFQVDLLIDSE